MENTIFALEAKIDISLDDINNLYISRFSQKYLEFQDSSVSRDDIDKRQLKKFYKDSIQYNHIPDETYSTTGVLWQFNLLCQNNLTNAANVLFGKSKHIQLKLATFSMNESLICVDKKN